MNAEADGEVVQAALENNNELDHDHSLNHPSRAAPLRGHTDVELV